MFVGPNGAGKSTGYAKATIEESGRTFWIINPDILSAQISRVESRSPLDANLEAVRRIETWLTASVAAYQTIGVETVLSTDKYRALVTEAKRRGFEFKLVYVLLRTPELHIERVKRRVKVGGHDVPVDRIIDRRARSLAQLPWFLEQADVALIYDNSGATPRLNAEKRNGEIFLERRALPEIRAAVESAAT